MWENRIRVLKMYAKSKKKKKKKVTPKIQLHELGKRTDALEK